MGRKFVNLDLKDFSVLKYTVIIEIKLFTLQLLDFSLKKFEVTKTKSMPREMACKKYLEML